MSSETIHIINGPNLNMLGRRENRIYGKGTLEDLTQMLKKTAGDTPLAFFQSNSEAELVGYIQDLKPKSKVILNAGAFTHTSIALRDALLAVEAEFIEVHISNIFARESFRHTSYLSDIARGVIVGFGFDSYRLALLYFLHQHE
ncbi:MAG: type II 3-dehydroquinate dehydratase [Leptospiraceae bacterium]|nr:type II 3-dehydroquinate dehydratase [Leptospiraceae bacterium]MDW8306566.1 type II 3-dehydroquinate dehydratase [Leptospiraceae bacterium]